MNKVVLMGRLTKNPEIKYAGKDNDMAVMEQLQNSSYNKSIVRQVHIAALHKEQQQIAEAVEKAERGDDG